MIRLWEIAFLGLIIGITKIHADKFAANKPISPLFHAMWTLIYFVPGTFLAWRYSSWWLVAACILERFVFYNVVLNIWRFGWNAKKFFYIHSGENGSVWDDLELKWASFYPFAWGIGMLGFIIIQFMYP